MPYYSIPLNKQWLVCSHDATSREAGTLESRKSQGWRLIAEPEANGLASLAILWCSDGLHHRERRLTPLSGGVTCSILSPPSKFINLHF